MVHICFKNNKYITKSTILTIAVFLGLFIFTNNNAFLYSDTIAKIVSSKIVSSTERIGTNGYSEKVEVQELKGKIINGEYKNRIITFQNEYVRSSIITTRYKKGEQIFVSINHQNKDMQVRIIDKKRDSVLILILGIFVILLIASCGKKGLLTVISLLANTITLALFLWNSSIGRFTSYLWLILCLVFIAVTLISVGGFTVKTLSSLLSSILTVVVIIGFYMITVKSSNLLKYETLEYVVAYSPLADIYMISVIFGSLGAIMDISVTINASASEICMTNQRINIHQLSVSLKEIEQDIMGTMVNVLFFSYISSTLPLIIMRMCHNYSWSLIFNYDFSFELIRFLIGSIGIILAIPISHLISLYFNRKVLI